MTPKLLAEQFSARDVILAHPVATFIIDGDGVIFEANPAAENMCNLARTHLIGLRVANIISTTEIDVEMILKEEGKSFAAYDLSFNVGRAGQQRADLLISPAHPEGFRMMALPQSGEAGKSNHRKPGSAARSAMGAAAMLAHEIKNPLSGIRGAAQLIENANGADTSRFAQLICTEVDRVAGLIDAMQNFTNEQSLTITPENIYPAISQACNIAKAGFAHDISIQENYDPSLPHALISHDALVQILINLVKNAAEALTNTNNPIIRISTAYRHGLSYDAGDGRGRIALPVEIMVSDNGPGVPDILIDDMFNPFVTGKTVGEGEHSGQGLGLALVDKLVREMGGLVRYHRDIEYGLTHFKIHLPTSSVLKAGA